MKRASQGLFRCWVVVGIVVGSLAASGRAWAQAEPPETGFGDKGHFALGAERMFGYVHVKQETSGSTSTTFNSISVLGSPIGSATSVFTFPRVGLDGFIAPSISLGGSLTYFHVSESGNGSVTLSGFLIAPRVGFAGRLAPTVWIWPRAGITYINFSNDSGGATSQSASLFAVTAEVPVVVALGPQALLTIGPTLDFGVSGSRNLNGAPIGVGNTSTDIKETDIGLQVSLLLYF